MRFPFFALLVAGCGVIGYAADPNSPAGQQAAAACRAVLEANFQAMNNEDVDALLATTSSKTGSPEQMAEFRAEAEKMFEDTDAYFRVDGFEFYKFQPPYAYAYVNQMTLPKNESDHYPREQGKLNFRHHSALLPEHKLVQYKQKFHFDNGQWKLHRVLSEPQPVDSWSARKLKIAGEGNGNGNRAPAPVCKDGKCSSPFIRVRPR
jgi:hypothetical protein